MFWILMLISGAAALFCLFLWLIHPASDGCGELNSFLPHSYAHRGLWDAGSGIPENSLPAFAAAADAGYAIELDIHLTADGKIVVFHDDTTERMCGKPYFIEKTTWDVLSELKLGDTEEHIPLFSEVLSLVAGRVPLLIELKLPFSDLSLCPAVMNLLDSYQGSYVIESFNTLGLRWLKKNRPDVLRGQLSSRFPRTLNVAAPVRWLTTMLLVNVLGRPHFIAYHYTDTDTPGFRAAVRFFRVPVFLWTVRTPEQYLTCKAAGRTVIFEKIRPGKSC